MQIDAPSELTIHQIKSFHEEIQKALKHSEEDIYIDLSAVEHCDSSGAQLLSAIELRGPDAQAIRLSAYPDSILNTLRKLGKRVEDISNKGEMK